MTVPQTTPAGAGLRLIRAAVFTAVCVVLSAVGHALASCAAVPWWALAVAFAGVFAVAAPLAGRRRSLPGLAAALAGGQLGLHAVFGLAQHGTAAQAADADAALSELAARLVCGGNAVPLGPEDARRILEAAGLDPAALAAQAAASAHAGHAGLAESAAPASGLVNPGMTAAHLLAALAAGWLLGRGDAALFRLVELSRGSAAAGPVRALCAALAFVRALGAGLTAAPAAGPRVRRTAADPAAHTGREALHHTVVRRGPPAAYALAA
ncbi:hypothetical protein C0216_30085 [Streptomyces globosus]|uniref:Integral membrane protein n=1 Tax=Streptomyces globosus TaxID=68209 RepID=A0A344U879_9ACTN|nr:hypothetical protein [Streptomyces globosus]AXE27100.1 hypothetical protein C0216_30085 [Streptomyces globosus]